MSRKKPQLCPCNSCGRKTEHEKVHKEVLPLDGADAPQTTQFVIRCCGCKSISILETQKNAQDVVIETYTPPRVWMARPKWVDDLRTLDDTLYGLLCEVYFATHDGQIRLLAMGVRAALDHTMVRIVGDIGGFEQKLEEMVRQKHLTEKQKEMLETVIDGASAAAHRGYRPPRDLIEEMMTVMATIIREYYITSPMLKTLKEKIPPRPPRPPKAGKAEMGSNPPLAGAGGGLIKVPPAPKSSGDKKKK